ALIDAYRRVFSPTEIIKAVRRGKYADSREKLAHRYMWWLIEKGLRKYIPFLEELEQGLYDASDHLQEDRLIKRVQKDGWWTFKEGNRTIQSLGLSPLELPIAITNNITCVTPSPPARRSAATNA